MGSKTEIKIELPEAVNKVLDKPATTLGEKISDLLEIIFGGITYSKEKLEYKRSLNFELFKKELEERVNSIPDDKRTEPLESIVGPALEAAKYRIDTEEFRKMFANLIASSLDSRKANFVHPAFVEIIKNLSPNDALAIHSLSFLRDSHIIPIISVDESVMSIPNNSNHYCFLVDDFGFHETNVILSSLLRSGLIEFNYVFNKDTNFQGFTFNDMERKFAKLRGDLAIGRNLDNPLKYRYGSINLTALGYEFAKVCVPTNYAELKRNKKNKTHKHEL